MPNDELDAAIMEALSGGIDRMTYNVRNIVARDNRSFSKIKTPQVLRALKRMEKSGKVARSDRNTYLVQICWRVV